MKKRTSERIILVLGLINAILTWIAGYYIMNTARGTIVGSIIFATIVSLIVFFESRFISISLRIDGQLAISREEITSNIGQFVVATLTALLVSIPMSILSVELSYGMFDGNLNEHIMTFSRIAGEYWLQICITTLFVVALFNAPIIVRLKSIDE